MRRFGRRWGPAFSKPGLRGVRNRPGEPAEGPGRTGPGRGRTNYLAALATFLITLGAVLFLVAAAGAARALMPGTPAGSADTGPLSGGPGTRIEVAGSSTHPSQPQPSAKAMTLTVPRLARAGAVPVETGPADDKRTLDAGALHLEGTGFPWEEDSNVYIAGHRLGYPGTGSNLLFFDLPGLENGDPVLLRDSRGGEYRYEVFRTLRVGPTDTGVTRPVPGKSVVSLQTCTLPNYGKRIVVQAELLDKP